MLNIAQNLQLPIEAASETIAILAKRGSGKTYTAAVLTEEMHAAGIHFVTIDPLGVWWGLRLGADGEPDGGIPVLILGGKRGDLPLDPAQGAAIARLVNLQRVSCVLDLSLLRKAEQATFLGAFLREIYELKAAEDTHQTLHLVVDEADIVAPQNPERWEVPMLDGLDDCIRRGRAFGLAATLITQRSANLAKNVLSQAEVLIAMRTSSPADRKTINDWISTQGTEEERKLVLSTLPSLDVGEAWGWAPNLAGSVRRIKVRTRRTFDSSKTPKPGEAVHAPQTLADLDLGTLREQFAQALSSALDDDPATLNARIRTLEKQLTERPVQIEYVEIPIISEEMEARLRDWQTSVALSIKDMQSIWGEVGAVLDKFGPRRAPAVPLENAPFLEAETPAQNAPLPKLPEPAVASALETAPLETGPSSRTAAPIHLEPLQQRMLDILAECAALGMREVSREDVADWLGVSASSSTTGKHIKYLRDLYLVTTPSTGKLYLTKKGSAYATPVAPPQTKEELVERWMQKLPAKAAEMLRVLAEEYPNVVTRAYVAKETGQSMTSSQFDMYCATLSKLGLVSYPTGGKIVATRKILPS